MSTYISKRPNDEKELLLRIAGGDEQAFSRLFHAWQARIFGYIRKIVKSPQVAEEATMDVMTRLWLNKEILAGVDHLDAFLFRMAYRRSVDFLRKAARSPRIADLLWEEMEQADTVSADSVITRKECEEKLLEAIGLLSPQRRKVYELSREGNLSHDEIATRLRLSKYTVSNHITDSVRLIRRYLVKYLDTGMIILYFLLLP